MNELMCIANCANDYIKSKANMEMNRTFLENFVYPYRFEDCFFTGSHPSNLPNANKINDGTYEVYNKETLRWTKYYRVNDLWLGIRFYA